MALMVVLLLAGLCYLSSVNAVSQSWVNGKIYTVDPNQPWAEALLIDEDGVLVAVGTTAEVQAAAAASDVANVIDLQGRLVLPGFQDSHLHVVEAGINAELCFIDEDALIEEVPFYFDDCPDNGFFADQGWIVGAGIDVSIILEDLAFDPSYNPIAILDEAYPDTPVLILDNLGHGAVANSLAMSIVGYDQLQDDPPGGILIRDMDNIGLVGVVLENAQQKLRDAAFPPTIANRQRAYGSLLGALGVLAQNGITTVSDAGGFYRQAQTESWARAESEGVLTVRASNALYVYPDVPLDEQLSELTSRYSNDPNALVRFNQAKIYVDGILELTTAALFEPYASWLELPLDEQFGFEYFGDNETLFELSTTLSNAGFQLHFHVTGDRGASLALDAIELASAEHGPHRLTHCYLVDELDRPRFAELGAIADFQLAPSSLSLEYAEFIGELTSDELAATLLPAREVFEAGGTVVLSSDWDADVLSPLTKIKSVLTRQDGRSFTSIEAVIPMLTILPATLLQHADKTGSIAVGKAADLVVLDKNIFELPVQEIDSARVLVTMLQGEVVYDPEGIIGESVGSNPTSAAAAVRLYGRSMAVFCFVTISYTLTSLKMCS